MRWCHAHLAAPCSTSAHLPAQISWPASCVMGPALRPSLDPLEILFPALGSVLLRSETPRPAVFFPVPYSAGALLGPACPVRVAGGSSFCKSTECGWQWGIKTCLAGLRSPQPPASHPRWHAWLAAVICSRRRPQLGCLPIPAERDGVETELHRGALGDGRGEGAQRTAGGIAPLRAMPSGCMSPPA